MHMNAATETLSVIQYLMTQDAIEAAWAHLRANDCRVGSLGYGHRNRIDAHQAAERAVSEADRKRLRDWIPVHGFRYGFRRP